MPVAFPRRMRQALVRAICGATVALMCTAPGAQALPDAVTMLSQGPNGFGGYWVTPKSPFANAASAFSTSVMNEVNALTAGGGSDVNVNLAGSTIYNVRIGDTKNAGVFTATCNALAGSACTTGLRLADTDGVSGAPYKLWLPLPREEKRGSTNCPIGSSATYWPGPAPGTGGGDDCPMLVYVRNSDGSLRYAVTMAEVKYPSSRVLSVRFATVLQARTGGIDGGWYSNTSDAHRDNQGHRGLPATVNVLTYEEIHYYASQALPIPHTVKIAIPHTAPKACFPYVGHESGSATHAYEGLVLQIRPGVAMPASVNTPAKKTLFLTLQKYGAVIGDQSGSGGVLKVEDLASNNVRTDVNDWPTSGVDGLIKDSLKDVILNPSLWVVKQPGFNPNPRVGTPSIIPCSA